MFPDHIQDIGGEPACHTHFVLFISRFDAYVHTDPVNFEPWPGKKLGVEPLSGIDTA
jgi:hypothetical protein